MGEVLSLIYDLLNRLPLEMAFIWMILLFFAGKFIHLGQLGLCGRGIPVLSARTRWADFSGRFLSYVLIGAGLALIGGFVYWLTHALYLRSIGA